MSQTPMPSGAAALRLDKTAFSVVTLERADDDREFWWSRTPQERWEALEINRQLVYGYDPATLRLQSVFSVVKRSAG